MKPQSVRLADVFFIGPLMVWGGLELREEYPLWGWTLALLGGATVVYNGYNYMQRRNEDQFVAILVTDLNDAGWDARVLG